MRRYGRLTQEERYQICALERSGSSKREMGRILNRHPSTICREIKRNRQENGTYFAGTAQRKAEMRRKPIHPPLRIIGPLKRTVTLKLKCQWSPEQISGRLRKDNILISHESIYQLVYRDFRKGGSLYLNLRRGRKRRRSQKAGKALKQCGKRLSYPSIRTRPSEVEKRLRLGDYERDSVLGKFKGPVLLTIVDRTSRLTRIGKLCWLNASITHRKTVELLKGFPIHTITNDNGPEFAEYKNTAANLKAQIYFNDPYSSWQRGTNENTNGLIRQYYPKGSDFSKVDDQDIHKLENLLNNRPRKCLGYMTPNEVQKIKIRSVALRT